MYLGLGYHRMGQEEAAGSAFDRGLALMEPGERGEVTDLSRVMKLHHAEAYDSLDVEERTEYDARYWRLTDPLL
ncbi:MAG: hypothetical protein GWN85_40530, partial [Gemmatimonadetes bacterium]|nr:hypothetical protein [Gemmatimonadota bacterium]